MFTTHALLPIFPVHCMENPVILGTIQMERFIRVHIFRRKSNTFRGITFFPVFTKASEFFCTIFSGQQGFLLWRKVICFNPCTLAHTTAVHYTLVIWCFANGSRAVDAKEMY